MERPGELNNGLLPFEQVVLQPKVKTKTVVFRLLCTSADPLIKTEWLIRDVVHISIDSQLIVDGVTRIEIQEELLVIISILKGIAPEFIDICIRKVSGQSCAEPLTGVSQ